jgi:CheY-like chemotaxis protein
VTAEPEPLVLIVDDYQDAREMYAEYLRVCGFRVSEAATGLEALDLARELSPDLILMDLSLPGIDGVEAARRLKADARTHGIPIVALTGRAESSASAAAHKAGCSGFLLKPALPEKIVTEIRRILSAEC